MPFVAIELTAQGRAEPNGAPAHSMYDEWLTLWSDYCCGYAGPSMRPLRLGRCPMWRWRAGLEGAARAAAIRTELVELGEERLDGDRSGSVWSDGVFFTLDDA